jgi:ubiquinone/menaquinone biosynthesis C-methylase UbiE
MTTDLVAHPADFAEVDGRDDTAALIEALDQLAADPAVQRLRARATEMLRLVRGHTVVDVGCGTGDTTRMLAAYVGPDGRAIGIERSHALLAEAQRRGHAANVQLRGGDVTSLDLADGSADRVWCERVLQHVDDPAAAVHEMARIARPGGRVVVIDTDWAMHAVHGADPELTKRIVTSWCDGFANGTSGRQLLSLAGRAGLVDVEITCETILSTDEQQASSAPITLMAAAAGSRGAVEEGEAGEWLAQLHRAARAGDFLWAITMFAAAGRRPGS